MDGYWTTWNLHWFKLLLILGMYSLLKHLYPSTLSLYLGIRTRSFVSVMHASSTHPSLRPKRIKIHPIRENERQQPFCYLYPFQAKLNCQFWKYHLMMSVLCIHLSYMQPRSKTYYDTYYRYHSPVNTVIMSTHSIIASTRRYKKNDHWLVTINHNWQRYFY